MCRSLTPRFSDRARARQGLGRRGLGDAGAGPVGEGGLQVVAAQPDGKWERVEENTERIVTAVGRRRSLDQMGGVAHPQNIGEGSSVGIGGARPDGVHGPPAAVQGQHQVEGQAVAAQPLDRAREGRLRVAFEAPHDVGEPGPGAGAEVEQHGEAARTDLLAIQVVPGIEAVRRCGQHPAPGFGFFGRAPVRAFPPPPAGGPATRRV